MSTVKRFAYVPLLILLCAWLGWAATGNAPVAGWFVAAALFIPAAVVWDRRRRNHLPTVRWKHDKAPRL